MDGQNVNPDLAIERKNATVDVESLKSFLGELTFGSYENYKMLMNIRDDLAAKIKPLFEENYNNLTRAEKHLMVYKKSLEVNEYFNGNFVDGAMALQVIGVIFGSDRYLFGLHNSAFMSSIDLWGTDEQKRYWNNLAKEKAIIGTYIQTELGHGTFLRGLETTATYDKSTQEFVIHSPTLTATKFWPGNSGHSANHGLVMANLIIDGKEHGMHAFIVQLRSLDDYTHLPGVESGDIGLKGGFESTDNGYVRFNKVRIPRTNMLMKYSIVTPDGKFSRQGNQMVIYASMLVLRGTLAFYVSNMLSMSSTIAIRYSCVRRQTANTEGEEQKIIEYQTQQYRLFASLATSYAMGFSAMYFLRVLKEAKVSTKNFETISATDLAKFHALTAGLKAHGYNTALKFTQLNRLCCGGHGYSAGSGLPQLIQEADAGCSYEGDNVVLLLQTARYLLKCAQSGVSPHFELDSFVQLKSTGIYKYFEKYLQIFYQLQDALINEIAGRLMKLVKEAGMSQYDAWNATSSLLINVAKVYITIYINSCNLVAVCSNITLQNQTVLADLFELYLTYEISDSFAGEILRMNVIDSDKMLEIRDRLYELLPKIRKNAVALVDAFDWQDSNLNSAIGTYDGRAYERLFDFAQKSQFNQVEVHEAYHKYLKPHALKLKRQQPASKL